MFKRAYLLASAATIAITAFTSETCETILIKGADGNPARVNKSDYDADQQGAKTMKEWKGDDVDLSVPATTDEFPAKVPTPSTPNFDGGAPAEPITAANVPNSVPAGDPAAAPATPAPAQQLLVTKEGTGAKAKFFVTAEGAKVERDGIDAAGYADEATAWQAIMALNGAPATAAPAA